LGTNNNLKALLLLHFIVLIFGFTGILGKLISINSQPLVWYRMLIASVCLAIYLKIRAKSFKIKRAGFIQTTLTGVVIAAHWVTFFESIKQSNVSIALAALSTASMFTAILEPLFFKRKFQPYEILLGLLIIMGLYFIFQFETENSIGIVIGIISAFLASLFTVINGTLIKKYDSSRISFYELSGGTVALTIYLLLSEHPFPNFQLSIQDTSWILLLAIFATAFAFVASVEVMKELSPFTVSLSINLEPIYGIILAYFIFGDEEKMSLGFYLGASCIISSLFINSYLKKRLKRKASMKSHT